MQKRIPDVARQGILDRLLLIGHIDGGIGSYRAFFERVYPESKTIQYNKTILANEIARHCDAFPGDWGDEAGMFSVVKILEWTDEQFLYFCKEYVNPVFNRYEWDEDLGERVNLQSRCVEAINFYLQVCGYELRQAGVIGDKVEYELIELIGVKGSIQGIVFAAVGKPDLIFTDFLNQDVEIPKNEEEYLYYDQKINTNGLKWGALKTWYENEHTQFDTKFIDRMWKSVEHCGSPIERKFFSAYLELVKELGDEVPALLPQVYMYYDSKVQRDRLKKIFDHQCMDFLMIISEGRRIVVELDGIQHYAEDEELKLSDRPYPVHIASTSRYSSMVSAQRDMTLAGYEVYRFGGKELYDDEEAERIVKQFFKDLFEKHGVSI